jgi:chromosome segregation protein
VYLKSLTMRGFKSFASSTTLQLEPGITCIVGPNGSGKSNVVDALAWVMGEQGAKSLRGGKMEDVIFAGTSGRPPLGRAEVALTIDNADGGLPIDYAEVTISRTMFRNGGSDYAINGSTCRLLDVQELLSDSGIGREMHVIVGQGQLDSILHATPEDRRGFVEEAAGVLKHRKRKEKALRKLDSTEGNLTRLQDLLNEIRRQLKPLGRQAEVARRAAVVQADARDARARLLADDLVSARVALQQELVDETILLERRAEVESAITAARTEEARLEAALREDLPALAGAQETWFALSGLRDRLTGTAGLAAERVRNAREGSEPASGPGREPEDLEAEALRVQAQEQQIGTEMQHLREVLDQSVAVRERLEQAHAEEDHRVAGLLRAAADRREGLARLHGQVNALRSRAAAAEEEIGRLTDARQEAAGRADRAQREFTSLESRVAGLDAGEENLDAEHEGAVSSLVDIEDRLAKAREEAQTADRERTGLAARKEALELGLSHKDGVGALLAAGEPLPGLLGSVAALLSVRSGFETAVAAALGPAADALALEHLDAAVSAIGRLKDEDLGRVGMLLGSGPGDGSFGSGTWPAPWPRLPDGLSYAVDVVECPVALRPALTVLLHRVAVVPHLAAARALVAELPEVTAVTRDGDVLGAHFAAGGSASRPSLIEVQAAVDEAAGLLVEAAHACERSGFELARLEEERVAAQRRVDVALARLHESDATLAAVAEELGQLGSLVRSAKAEAERMATAISAAQESRDRDLAGLSQLEQRLRAAEAGSDEEPDLSERERLADQSRASRQAETDARLALRTAEERARALAGRADSLNTAARAEREGRARAAARRERLIREGMVAEAVGHGVAVVLQVLERSVALAAAERSKVEADRRGREESLLSVRASLRDLAAEHEELVSTVHRDELARTQQRMRLEQLEERALVELGQDVETLVTDYGPDRLVPVLLSPEQAGALEPDCTSDGTAGQPAPVPFVREEQEKRLRSAERALAMLGRVNPLALEEFSALEERHQFLGEQLEDLRRTRRDLLDIVREVDERVEQVFTEAWHDVNAAFGTVFERLFPGGEGTLVLTDPSDMLTTGIEVEARPAGKKVKRLSLLSGGERSLVAVAFLVALFKARPSPFYILDEVEAALDDTNLGRLLEIYEELRETSQLLVITHQKRTMEVGDALYGVSMRGDGVSAVISQRLREPAGV